ncbi:MAG: PEP-CTERM sorting domain-containing protein [Phycisphaerae bacterium]|nr:PEP-CTERM sorting domain-containing protein [Phycisphaerae bacterium]
MRTNLLKVFACVVVVVAAAGIAGATPITLADLGSGSLSEGNLTFSDFSVSAMAMGVATAPDASGINVETYTAGGKVGLRFTGLWTASGTGFNLALSTINFKVHAADGHEITGATLNLINSFCTGTGETLISENVHRTNPLIEANSVGGYLVQNPGDGSDGGSFTTGLGYQDVWVAKSIVAQAVDPTTPGLAMTSQFGQLFDVTHTPEPASLTLMGIGGLGLLIRRRRKRKSA